MLSNVIGRVRNTPLSKYQGLFPLFEALANSIDAIEEVGRDRSNGLIEIRILRNLSFALSSSEDTRVHSSIYGFEITDNGIGFTEKNYHSFNEADSLSKSQKGGKGVGRFVWLKAFDKVEIESVFENEQNLFKRLFVFSLDSSDGIKDHKIEAIDNFQGIQTKVRLLGFKEEYEKNVPRSASTIAQRIVEHCLEYFVLGKMPVVKLYDEELENEGPLDLDNVYENLIAKSNIVTVEISGQKFDIAHFMLHARADLKHHISYCANQRVVITENIGNKIPNLPSAISDNSNGNEPFVYAGYVSSDYLDKRVNQQRTNFDTAQDGNLPYPGDISWSEIQSKLVAAAQELLYPYTEQVRVHKEEQVGDYVNTSAPQYRYIIKNHKEFLDTIPPNPTEEEMDTKLYEIHRQIGVELKKEGQEFIEQSLSSDTISEEDLEEFSNWFNDYNDVGKAELAKYIIHRKWVLNVLEKALKLQATGKYSKEEILHQIIFPLRSTSDDLTYDKHNLWIIDEKLAYHSYLASDIPLNKVSPLNSASSSRLDMLMMFDQAFAVVDEEPPFHSGMVIFEFKRPMRNNYNSDDNPITQVLGYVQEIKDGKVITKDGRPINVPATTPFYCYVVCDITKTLAFQAKLASLRPTPDNCGYFGYNDAIGAYIEVISFDKLLSDAKKRNRILFDKLNLPDKLC